MMSLETKRSSFDESHDFLKKALLQFPRRYDHEFSPSSKVDLRRLLYFAASHKGDFMKNLFPNADEHLLPKLWEHVVDPERFQHLEDDDIYFSRDDSIDAAHPKRACGRKFRRGEPIHRCVTCAKDEGCGLCSDCFDETLHSDHQVITTICNREAGGVCDCGDPESWNIPFICDHFKHHEVPEHEIPDEFKESLLQTFQIVLDYVVDVLAGSTANIPRGKFTNESILADSHRSTLNSSKYLATDWSSDRFYLLIYNDNNRQFRDAVARVRKSTNKVEQFAMMAAAEAENRGRAKVMDDTDINELLGHERTLSATGFCTSIRNASELFREDMCVEILMWINSICTGSLLGNYNIARDLLTRAFCEKWRSGVIPLINGGIAYLENNLIPLNIVNNDLLNLQPQLHWNVNIIQWNIDSKLADECDYDPAFTALNKGHFLHGSRLQYFLFFDIRMWKYLRSVTHNIFNSIIASNIRYRSLVCAQFVDVHSVILELFFHFDKDPENSVLTSLNAQIFGCESNATMIAERGSLSVFLAASYGFLTTLHAATPQNITVPSRLDSNAFKGRKMSQIFYDICCVLLKTKNFDQILNENFVNQICDILDLFQGRPAFKREALEHVEYETNAYAIYFNMFSMTSTFLEMFLKIFLKVKDSNNNNASLVGVILKRIIDRSKSIPTDLPQETDESRFDYQMIQTASGSKSVIDFHVHNDMVSFLHPLQSFFTRALQVTGLNDFSSLGIELDELQLAEDSLIEYPLRVHVLLAQIRAGFWVRNGFSIKNQRKIYETSAIRETSYKRDLALVQFIMSNSNPDDQLLRIFFRWEMVSWLEQNFADQSVYPDTLHAFMVEQCLVFFIHLLTDSSCLVDPQITREDNIIESLIHTLCFGPLSYSKLCAEIPDFLVNEKRFDIYLKKVTDFVSPKHEESAGLYKLKPEFLKRVNPYYVHYTPNNSEAAEKLIRENQAQKSQIKYKETFLLPQSPNLEGSALKDLYRFTSSRLFVQFLKSCLKYINNEGISKTEKMLQLTLHLIHICIDAKNLGHAAAFSETLWYEFGTEHNEPFYYESVGSILYKFLVDEHFSDHHAKIRAIYCQLTEKNVSVEGFLKEQVPNFGPSVLGAAWVNEQSLVESDFEKKRRMAKERQLKIMAKFKKQQKKFAQVNKSDLDQPESDQPIENDDSNWKYSEEHCILCQMPAEEDMFGIVCHIRESNITRTISMKDQYWTIKCFEDSGNLDSDDAFNKSDLAESYLKKIEQEQIIGPAFVGYEGNKLEKKVVATGCAHGMHYSCFKNHLATAKNTQLQITKTVPEDFENYEYVCPLCKSLGNCFLPVLWSSNSNKLENFVMSSNNWFREIEQTLERYLSDELSFDEIARKTILTSRESLSGKYKETLFSSGPPSGFYESMDIMEQKSSLNNKLSESTSINRLVSNTIKSIEISVRGVQTKSGMFTDSISSQLLTHLRTLIEYRKTWIAACCLKSNDLKNDSLEISFIEGHIAKLCLFSSRKFFELMVETDIFELMICSTGVDGICLNSHYTLGVIYHILKTLSVLLCQLKSDHFSKKFTLFDISTVRSDDNTLQSCLKLVRTLRDKHPIFDNLPDEVFERDDFPAIIYTILVHSLNPFLRRIAIWAIGDCGEVFSSPKFTEDYGLEVDRLCHILNLPKLSELLVLFTTEGTPENAIFRDFTRYVETTDNDLNFTDMEYSGVIKLLHLPERIDILFSKYLNKMELFNETSNPDPCICLTCGEVMQLQSQWTGNKLGNCTNHIENECSDDTGVFLAPRHASFLLIHRGIGSFYPIPYVDSHGDPEFDQKSSNLLYLKQNRYDKFIREVWLENNIPNYITRKLEGCLDIGGWDTI